MWREGVTYRPSSSRRGTEMGARHPRAGWLLALLALGERAARTAHAQLTYPLPLNVAADATTRNATRSLNPGSWAYYEIDPAECRDRCVRCDYPYALAQPARYRRRSTITACVVWSSSLAPPPKLLLLNTTPCPPLHPSTAAATKPPQPTGSHETSRIFPESVAPRAGCRVRWCAAARVRSRHGLNTRLWRPSPASLRAGLHLRGGYMRAG